MRFVVTVIWSDHALATSTLSRDTTLGRWITLPTSASILLAGGMSHKDYEWSLSMGHHDQRNKVVRDVSGV